MGQGADEGDPYTRLYAYDQVTLPFAAFTFDSRSVLQGGGQRLGRLYWRKLFGRWRDICLCNTQRRGISQKQGLSVSEREYPEYRCRTSLMLRETGMGAGIQPVYTV